MTTESTAEPSDGSSGGDAAVDDGAEATRYEVELDRDACEGIFACLVRDDRFREAADGLATVEADDGAADGVRDATASETLTAGFEDDRIEEARSAAAACPVDAISVEVVDGA